MGYICNNDPLSPTLTLTLTRTLNPILTTDLDLTQALPGLWLQHQAARPGAQ